MPARDGLVSARSARRAAALDASNSTQRATAGQESKQDQSKRITETLSSFPGGPMASSTATFFAGAHSCVPADRHGHTGVHARTDDGSAPYTICTPGWQGRVAAEADRVAAVRAGISLGGPSTWGPPTASDPPLPSTRYIAPPDITAKWGASRLPGVPSRLVLAPQSTPLEKLVGQRPFLRFTDFLQNNLDRQPPAVTASLEIAPVPRPAQLAARRR